MKTPYRSMLHSWLKLLSPALSSLLRREERESATDLPTFVGNAQGTKEGCKNLRRARLAALTVTCLFVFFITVCQDAKAHGELLIRIAATSRQIEAATNNAQLYLARGELYREDTNWSAAASDYDRAAQLDPTLDAVDLCRAKMLADSGELESARARFDTVIGRSAQDGEAFVGRARMLVQLGWRDAAMADFQRGLALLQAPPPEYFLELAQTFVAEGNVEEALGALDKGIRKCGPLVMLQEYALNLEREQGNYDSAVVRIDTIIRYTERKEKWFADRGEILLIAGRPAAARESFGEALAAIDSLPQRLQQGPAMQSLRARIHTALAKSKTDTAAADTGN